MCTSPRTASYNLDGSINFSHKKHDRQMVPFKLPCGKCTECRLERAREWSIRCVHEAKMHKKNSFITLTYSDKYLPQDHQLNHTHFQLFMKRLRKHTNQKKLGYFMCGEYGEQTHRPHYHACIFGWEPEDKKIWSKNHMGDNLYTSKTLDKIWGFNDPELCPNKIGEVTQKSASYVARYVLKKQKKDKSYQKSSRINAIGKRWIEKYWKDVFIHAKGSIILSDGTKSKVPRYYEKWFKDNYPDYYKEYLVNTKHENTKRLEQKAEIENKIYQDELNRRRDLGKAHSKSPSEKRKIILEQKQQSLKRSYL